MRGMQAVFRGQVVSASPSPRVWVVNLGWGVSFYIEDDD